MFIFRNSKNRLEYTYLLYCKVFSEYVFGLLVRSSAGVLGRLGYIHMILCTYYVPTDLPGVYEYPIIQASDNGDFPLVSLLLDFGCDPRVSGNISVYFAMDFGHTDVALLLLESGADPKIGPAFVCAVTNNLITVATAISKRGVVPEKYVRRGMYHAVNHSSAEIIQLLNSMLP